METTKLTIKVFVDKKTNTLLFAEAGKDFVDFLFSLLTLPLGSVISLITKKKMVGCLSNLYESVENLSAPYFLQPNQHEDLLLKPKLCYRPDTIPLLPRNMGGIYYQCHNSCGKITRNAGTLCSCNREMNKTLTYVDNGTSIGEEGYVKGTVVTYMVTDDLVVMPMSAESSLSILNKFEVDKVSSIEVKEVDITLNKGMELLSTSLVSNKVLSQVFFTELIDSNCSSLKNIST